jgi:hypothetical protein
MTKEIILQGCTVEGSIVRLPPGELDRKLYEDVAKSLKLIGGQWKGGKTMGFVFSEDPTNLLAQIARGTKRDIKKEYQFFATSDSLADQLVEMAEIEEYDNVLEPSAGQGAIVKAIHRQHPATLVHYCELMELNRTFLTKIPNTVFIKENFLTVKIPATFHKIIANPPFSKNQDIQHIFKMWDCLVPGGRIVTVSSKHWQYATGKKEDAFNQFLRQYYATVIDVAAGEFKDSGTNIATCIIIIDKPTS